MNDGGLEQRDCDWIGKSGEKKETNHLAVRWHAINHGIYLLLFQVKLQLHSRNLAI